MKERRFPYGGNTYRVHSIGDGWTVERQTGSEQWTIIDSNSSSIPAGLHKAIEDAFGALDAETAVAVSPSNQRILIDKSQALDPASYIYELGVLIGNESNDLVPLGAATDALSWEENENELSVRLMAHLRNLQSGNQMVHELVSLNSKVVLMVDWGAGPVEIFRGTVMDWTYTDDGTQSVSITAYDGLIHMQKSQDVLFVNEFLPAKDHIIRLLNKWQLGSDTSLIKGPLAQIPTPQLIRESSVTDMIMKILRLAFEHGDAKPFTNRDGTVGTPQSEEAFLMRMRIVNNQEVIEVVNEGGNNPIYWLREDTGIVSVADERSIMDLVTVVRVYNNITELVSDPILKTPGSPKAVADSILDPSAPPRGTLTAGSYGYQISAVDTRGETVASPEVSVEVPEVSNGTVTLTWADIGEATGYRIYGRTPGENTQNGAQKKGLLSVYNGNEKPGAWTVGSGTSTKWVDNGSAAMGAGWPISGPHLDPETGQMVGGTTLPDDIDPRSSEWRLAMQPSTFTLQDANGSSPMLDKFGRFVEIWDAQTNQSPASLAKQAKDYLRVRGVPNIKHTIVAPDIPFLRRGEFVAIQAGTVGTAEFDNRLLTRSGPSSKAEQDPDLAAHLGSGGGVPMVPVDVSWGTTPAVLYTVTGIHHDATSHQMTVTIDSYGVLGKKWSRTHVEDFLPDPLANDPNSVADSQASAATDAGTTTPPVEQPPTVPPTTETPTPPPWAPTPPEKSPFPDQPLLTPPLISNAFQFTSATVMVPASGGFLSGITPLTVHLGISHKGPGDGYFKVILDWRSILPFGGGPAGDRGGVIKSDEMSFYVTLDHDWTRYPMPDIIGRSPGDMKYDMWLKIVGLSGEQYLEYHLGMITFYSVPNPLSPKPTPTP